MSSITRKQQHIQVRQITELSAMDATAAPKSDAAAQTFATEWAALNDALSTQESYELQDLMAGKSTRVKIQLVRLEQLARHCETTKHIYALGQSIRASMCWIARGNEIKIKSMLNLAISFPELATRIYAIGL